jgi:hypothetical protein
MNLQGVFSFFVHFKKFISLIYRQLITIKKALSPGDIIITYRYYWFIKVGLSF